MRYFKIQIKFVTLCSGIPKENTKL